MDGLVENFVGGFFMFTQDVIRQSLKMSPVMTEGLLVV